VRGEHELDRQLEQWPQSFGDLLAGNAVLQHLRWDLEAATEVDQRIAGDDRAPTLDPKYEVVVRPAGKRLDPDRKPVARRVQVGLAATGSRSAAASRSSPGTASGSRRSNRAPSSSA
jgi:hypothetical protein